MRDRDSKKSKNGGPQGSVGYGQPPKNTRFKPGNSGNPAGRPKGTRNFKSDLRAALTSLVDIARNGESKKVSMQKAMIFNLFEKAVGGDIRALDRALRLAETYGGDDNRVDDISASDKEILTTYAQRVRSGVIDADADGEKGDPNDKSKNK